MEIHSQWIDDLPSELRHIVRAYLEPCDLVALQRTCKLEGLNENTGDRRVVLLGWFKYGSKREDAIRGEIVYSHCVLLRDIPRRQSKEYSFSERWHTNWERGTSFSELRYHVENKVFEGRNKEMQLVFCIALSTARSFYAEIDQNDLFHGRPPRRRDDMIERLSQYHDWLFFYQ
jgi:hypothetical protein